MSSPVTEKATLNELLEVLTHPYRRRILSHLFERNPRDEDEFDPAELASIDEDPELLELELHHGHLPRLAESAFVDWDREENLIRRGPRFDEIAPLIRLMANHEDELPADWP